MTIPKFRAWDKHIGKMFSVGIIDYTIHSVYVKQPNGLYTESDFDEVELMQFTGLKDKNGKEVFEGDIIRFFDCDGDEYTVPVVWDNDYACFSVDWGSNMLTSFDYLEEFYTDLKDIEAIGNIYENLSLIR
ncbi:YopX family protein [Streptococcus gallolyticus]|uniref:YopX family protein n=1 Tax=Streptococcus gallolyticus TaxID=315405 RepID=UPI0034A2020C